MKKIISILILILFTLTGCITDNPTDPSVRMNISGTIVTNPMIGMKTIKDRGISNLAFVLKEENLIQYQHTALTIFGNEQNMIPLSKIMDNNPNRESLLGQLKALKKINFIDVSHLENEMLAQITESKWNGTRFFAKGSEGILAKLQKLGVEALIFVDEDPYPDNDVTWTISSHSGSDNTYKFIGMYEIAVIDVKSGKQVKNCNYIQGSLEEVQLTSDFSKGIINDTDTLTIKEAVSNRADVNALEALRMLKILERE